MYATPRGAKSSPHGGRGRGCACRRIIGLWYVARVADPDGRGRRDEAKPAIDSGGAAASPLATARAYFAEIQKQDFYLSLGVAREAGPDEIHRAFLRLAKRWHPNLHALENAEVRSLVEEIFIFLKRGHDTLMDPAKASAYRTRVPTANPVPPAPAKPAGNAAAATAKTPVRTPAVASKAAASRPTTGPPLPAARAIPAAAKAAPAARTPPQPDDIDKVIQIGSDLLTAYDFRLARAAFERALARDPTHPGVRALLAVVAAREFQVNGQLPAAVKQYEAALAIDPSCGLARAGLNQIEEMQAAPKRGLFRKFFFDE
ncbi:MAG: hypothetical protein EXR72_07330 [Myxococcales bacterium]|nr:hypothetical protein [Myxococcales bacterium]